MQVGDKTAHTLGYSFGLCSYQLVYSLWLSSVMSLVLSNKLSFLLPAPFQYQVITSPECTANSAHPKSGIKMFYLYNIIYSCRKNQIQLQEHVMPKKPQLFPTYKKTHHLPATVDYMIRVVGYKFNHFVDHFRPKFHKMVEVLYPSRYPTVHQMDC